jgi:hypothetical protein
MKKRGRPTKAAADRRNVVLRLRLTEGEFNDLIIAAKKTGEKTISSYARKKIIGR